LDYRVQALTVNEGKNQVHVISQVLAHIIIRDTKATQHLFKFWGCKQGVSI